MLTFIIGILRISGWPWQGRNSEETKRTRAEKAQRERGVDFEDCSIHSYQQRIYRNANMAENLCQ